MDIVTSSDKNYGQHTGIMLMSLLACNVQKDLIRVTILDGGILPEDKSKINRVFLKHKRALPNYIPISNDRFGKTKVDGHISIATYYRILLPEIFLDINKVLYLDSDLIVNAPLNELWDTDIDDYYGAAVQDSGAPDQTHLGNLNMPGAEKYFNAGVLLVNLKKWRDEAVTEKLMHVIQFQNQQLRYWDQDALNSALWKKIIFLNPKFNVMVHFLRKNHSAIYSDEEIARALKNPAIIHYNSENKPWNTYCQNKLKEYYHHYWEKSEWRNTKPLPPSLIETFKTFLLNNLGKDQIRVLKKIKDSIVKKL